MALEGEATAATIRKFVDSGRREGLGRKRGRAGQEKGAGENGRGLAKG